MSPLERFSQVTTVVAGWPASLRGAAVRWA